MELNAIAGELVAGCREGREVANLTRLYAPGAVSIEAVDMGNGREAVGLDAIRGKHDWWADAMEVLESEVTGPMLHGEDRFAVIFRMNAREKASGEIREMQEVGVYTVADGRIVREEFFY